MRHFHFRRFVSDIILSIDHAFPGRQFSIDEYPDPMIFFLIFLPAGFVRFFSGVGSNRFDETSDLGANKCRFPDIYPDPVSPSPEELARILNPILV